MVTVLISPGGIYQSRITGSRGNSVFKFLTGHQTVFPSGCFILQSLSLMQVPSGFQTYLLTEARLAFGDIL